MSRTGTNGGLRRGAAAAAIGAVLVLATGVPASQAAEGSPDANDPAVPAVDTASLPIVAQLKGSPAAAREDAANGQTREDKNGSGKAPAGNGRGAASSLSAGPGPNGTPSAVPSALRPAVTATQKPAPAPTATASPVPTASAQASATRPPTRAPGHSASATTGTAPGAAPPVSHEVPAQGAGAPAPETSAAEGGTAPAQPVSPDLTVAGELPAAAEDRAAKDQYAAEAGGAAAAGTAAAGKTAYVPIYSLPQAQPGWTPYAAAVPGNSVRTSASLNAQPEPKSALVWLGSGLVGVAGAAGLVFFRLRNP